jgi:molybdopterin-guanine dinucleotide biosynthesis protein A
VRTFLPRRDGRNAVQELAMGKAQDTPEQIARAAWPGAVIGVLIAGGLARRMGGVDKALLRLGGRPLLAHAIERLRPQTSHLVINANGDPSRFAAFGLEVVPDPIPGFAGPLAGVLAGLEWALSQRPDARWIATAAPDTPFFPLDLVSRLLAAGAPHYPRIAVATTATRMHPLFALWPVAFADALRTDLIAGTRTMMDEVARLGHVTVEFAPIRTAHEAVDPFFNANRPEDLIEAERLARITPADQPPEPGRR